MSAYNPEKWVVVKIEGKDIPLVYKVFACWHGGYLNGDSWKYEWRLHIWWTEQLNKKTMKNKKLDREKVFKHYMKWVDEVSKRYDWKSTFGPEEIVQSICEIIENEDVYQDVELISKEQLENLVQKSVDNSQK